MWRVISMPILGIFHQTFPDGLCDTLQVDLPSMQVEPVTDCIAAEATTHFLGVENVDETLVRRASRRDTAKSRSWILCRQIGWRPLCAIRTFLFDQRRSV